VKLFAPILLFGIRLYQWVLSPAKAVLFGPFGRCRFTPSCSAYALAAIQSHGPWRGSWLALRRLARCHPYGDWGEDPVPPPKEPRATARQSQPGAGTHPPAPCSAKGEPAPESA